MKKIKKEYIFISVLLVLFLILTMFVVSGKTSILDDIPGTQMPELEENFEGGFVINTDLDENKK